MDISKFKSLFRNRRDQDIGEVFAHFHPTRDSLKNELDFDAPFTQIAKHTFEGESAWYFTSKRFEDKHKNKPPKLRNYLNYTFIRLRDLELEFPEKYFSCVSDWVCFNTGLQDPHGSDLYAIFQRYFPPKDSGPAKPAAEWVYKGIATAREESFRRHFGRNIPDLAWYSSDSRDYIFNTQYSLETEVFDHMFERAKQRSGFAADASDEAVRNYLRGAIENIVPKIKRNYKTAIPMYYVEEKRMQLLLPFHSSNGKDTACFLVERDDINCLYRIKTVLDMDQAFFAARLITRPDKEWLNP